ncbi:acyltransferase [Ramlibacter sp. USB13]|uniref:Acyltransferase n=1 Tax=Ramlibacter cellulosilyticus TaxID=2764187 RepID=A0A923MKL4_9BURK|nr:acyltransferase [Ramlibacter cellulosilyticus]MBC5781337.1 acyltransferase [Ramlibacter cellulosilyticus]
MEKAARPFFPLVDALRAFAALTVLVYHFIAHWDWTDFPATGPLAWFRGGWMAVDVFFVISGFVIGLSAFGRLDAQGEGFRKGFLRARLARIVPLHFLTLAAYLAFVEPALWSRDDIWPNVVAHLAFVHNLFFDWYGAINGPNWSLGVEMQFYLLVVLAAPWLRKVRPLPLALLFVLTAWAWRWGAHLVYQPGPVDVAYMAQTQLPGMLDEFALGLLLARLVRSASGQALLRRVGTESWLRHGLVLVAALGWWGVVALHQQFDYWEEPAMAVFFRTGVAGCAALTVLLLCAVRVSRESVTAQASLYLGKISYGLYLWHIPVLFLLGRHTEMEPLRALPIAIGITTGLAVVTWHCVEEPLLRRWAGRKSPASPTAERVRAAPDGAL